MSDRKINPVNTGANFLARVFTHPSIGFLGYFGSLILVLFQTQDEKLYLSSKFKSKANFWFNSKEKFYVLVFSNDYKYSYIFAKIFGNIFSYNNKGTCFQQKRLSFFFLLVTCTSIPSRITKKVPRSVAQQLPLDCNHHWAAQQSAKSQVSGKRNSHHSLFWESVLNTHTKWDKEKWGAGRGGGK